MSDMDQRLKRALDEHTEGVRVVADLADRAIARDRSNRRRELGVAALAAGLVLAVAVPVGWGALRPTGARPLPVGPSQTTTAPTGRPSPTAPRTTTATPTAIPTLTASGAPAPVTARFTTGPVTATPSAPYVVDGVIHDGTKTLRVQPAGRWGALAQLEGGRWLLTDADSLVTTVVDDQGAFIFEITGTTRVSQYGTLIASSDVKGNLHAYASWGDELGSLAAATCACSGNGGGMFPGYEVIGVVGRTVYANRGDADSSVAWDLTTDQTRQLPFRLDVVDPAQGTTVVSVAQEGSSASPCHELRDLLTGAKRWRLCGPLVFRSFSTNGAYLLATGLIDGLDGSQLNPDRSFRYGGLVVVRTSDAAIVLEGSGDATTGNGSPVTYRMGDDGTITVQVGEAAGARNLQRCTLDGACEVVAPALPRSSDIPEGDDPYFLSTN